MGQGMTRSKARLISGFANPAATIGLSSCITTFFSSSALAQAGKVVGLAKSELMLGAAPIAIIAGIALFGVVAATLALRNRVRVQSISNDAAETSAKLRAKLDGFEALLSTMPETTIFWGQDEQVEILGRPSAVSDSLEAPSDILNFNLWLTEPEGKKLTGSIQLLRSQGHGFDLTLAGLNGEIIRAAGRPFGMGAAVRLRRASAFAAGLTNVANPEPANAEAPELLPEGQSILASAAPKVDDVDAAKSILSLLQQPAWMRDRKGTLIYTNEAYGTLLSQLGMDGDPLKTEIFPQPQIRGHLGELGAQKKFLTVSKPLPDQPNLDLVVFKLDAGTAGYLQPVVSSSDAMDMLQHAHVPGVIEALTAPVAVFDAKGKMVHFNSAYASFWDLDEDWLRQTQSEKSILDRLRTRDFLPQVADFQNWKAAHLKANYGLKSAREDTWHLPDGRTINLVAAPASELGGVIYVFEDVTDKLRLETEKIAMVNAQRETLNALSEGVAVFSTNGRLRLYNPRLATLWNVPLSFLKTSPHINEFSETVAQAFPEDGQRIWGDLKRKVVNLNPERSDETGRITRADGSLLDYSAIHLPNGQVMLTFVDVTRSANYERMLKERNDALVTADKLKDAFVQSVSYELRSPLTNIIGFADLLASDSFGPLNDRQRQYTDYIRAQSATLGVLIDNILDLTNVDAGIAELDKQDQTVADLIARAKAGIDATFMGAEGEQPINLTIKLDDDLPVFQADGKRIVQVLFNLLSNAAKFSEPGSEVVLRAQSREDWVDLIVEDEGIGVPQELSNAVHQKLDARSIEGRQRGVGLGLTIANAFVQLHGGSIAFEKRDPRGTRVTVHLPIRSAIEGGGSPEVSA